jgi:predicted DCC family thiol-disulfide oxidoreductase YuxK
MGTLFSIPMIKPAIATKETTPPGRIVVLYDGLCKFCQAGMKRLLALAKPGAIEPVNFQEPGALERFPGISHEACMKQMYLVTPQGKVYGGFEAAVRALATRPIIGRLAYAYYLPGVRFLCDFIYATIARHRYRILGKAVAKGECPEGTCVLHARGHGRTIQD